MASTDDAILEELRGIRADYARVVGALARIEDLLGTTSTNSPGGGSRSRYAREATAGPGLRAPGPDVPPGAPSHDPARAALTAEHNAAPKRYPKPSVDDLSRLDAIYTETTGRKPLSVPARRYLVDAVQVHGTERTAELIPAWYRARGTADDLLLYLRTPRDPFAPEGPPALEDDGYPPSALEAEEPDLEDFSGIPLDTLPYRQHDPREGPEPAAHPWDSRGFLSTKPADRRTA